MTKGDRVALHDLRTFSVLDNIDTKDFKSKKSPLNIRSDLRRLMSMLNQYFMCRVIFISSCINQFFVFSFFPDTNAAFPAGSHNTRSAAPE